MKKFVDPYRPAGRFFYFLLSLLMATAVSRTRAQTAPATTLVQDTVYSANGAAISVTDAVANKEIINPDQFRDGLSKIIDGTVACLNASSWGKK